MIILERETKHCLTVILLIFFVQKMLSVFYNCCIYSNALQTNFITEANNMNMREQSDLGPYCLLYTWRLPKYMWRCFSNRLGVKYFKK